MNATINVVQNKNLDQRILARAGLVGTGQPNKRSQETNILLNEIFSNFSFDICDDSSKVNSQTSPFVRTKSSEFQTQGTMDSVSEEAKIQYLRDAYTEEIGRASHEKDTFYNGEGIYK